jgi:hypothetical protein
MSGAILPLSVYGVMACTETTFTLFTLLAPIIVHVCIHILRVSELTEIGMKVKKVNNVIFSSRESHLF